MDPVSCRPGFSYAKSSHKAESVAKHKAARIKAGVAIGASRYTRNTAAAPNTTTRRTYDFVPRFIKGKDPQPSNYLQPPQSANDRTPLIRASTYDISRHLPVFQSQPASAE